MIHLLRNRNFKSFPNVHRSPETASAEVDFYVHLIVNIVKFNSTSFLGKLSAFLRNYAGGASLTLFEMRGRELKRYFH